MEDSIIYLILKAKPGETVLIHGASGAVGNAVVQIARAMGVTVIGTAGTKEGMEVVLRYVLCMYNFYDCTDVWVLSFEHKMAKMIDLQKCPLNRSVRWI